MALIFLFASAVTVEHSSHIADKLLVSFLKSYCPKKILGGRGGGSLAYVHTALVNEIHCLSCQNEHCFKVVSAGSFLNIVYVSTLTNLELRHTHYIPGIYVEHLIRKGFRSIFCAA